MCSMYNVVILRVYVGNRNLPKAGRQYAPPRWLVSVLCTFAIEIRDQAQTSAAHSKYTFLYPIMRAEM